MKKKCALCLRGCIDKIKSGHFHDIDSIYSNGNYINVYSIYNSIETHIINNNQDFDFDFFIHCWNPDMKDIMCDLYKPKAFLFENQNLYRDIVNCSSDGQKLGISKSLDLMINYSERMSIKYDKIIIYRPDVLLYKNMNLNNYIDNNIYCNDNIRQDFHFIMNYNNAKKFKNIINYKINFYEFCKNVLNNPIIADNIKCGIDQEVLRKLKMASIDRHNIDRTIFYKYGLNDAEIELMTHI